MLQLHPSVIINDINESKILKPHELTPGKVYRCKIGCGDSFLWAESIIVGDLVLVLKHPSKDNKMLLNLRNLKLFTTGADFRYVSTEVNKVEIKVPIKY